MTGREISFVQADQGKKTYDLREPPQTGSISEVVSVVVVRLRGEKVVLKKSDERNVVFLGAANYALCQKGVFSIRLNQGKYTK